LACVEDGESEAERVGLWPPDGIVGELGTEDGSHYATDCLTDTSFLE